MLDLSIIIVNYNVRYFLAQCLDSILRSELDNFSIEIIVVDNNSTDGSFPYLEERYGEAVTFIKNEMNVGFGSACNIGLHLSKGESILFLNPDTIIEKDTLKKSLYRLNSEDELGALGVRLIDGQGRFLKESKRAFPTPWNSFLKLSGLATIVPMGMGNPYNLNHLSDNSSHYIEVLCGAYMMVKKSALDKVGSFDEDFFMYGEDIDLSKRLSIAGYRLLYFHETSVIHYKGESHKAKNIGYYRNFYSAMSIYSSKHYGVLTAYILKLAIYVAGILTWFFEILKKVLHPVMDFAIAIGILLIIKYLWATIYFGDSNYYPDLIVPILFIYALTLILSLGISRHYKRYSKLRSVLSGVGIAIIVVFLIHALLPTDLRFSRMILIIFSFCITPVLLFNRLIYNYLVSKEWKIFNNSEKKAIIIGFKEGFDEISELLKSVNPNVNIIGRVNEEDPSNIEDNEYLGHIAQLGDLITIFNPQELIFNMDEVESSLLFSNLKQYGQRVNFKGYGRNILGVIGSSNPSISGELYTTQIVFNIDFASARILKWGFDKLVAVLLLVLFPLTLLMNTRFLSEAFRVLRGRESWIGYNTSDPRVGELPEIKKGIVKIGNENATGDIAHFNNLQYARNYSITLDIEILLRYLSGLSL